MATGLVLSTRSRPPKGAATGTISENPPATTMPMHPFAAAISTK